MKNIFSSEKRALFGLSFGHFTVDLYAAILTPLFPLITSKLGVNLATMSLVLSIGHMIASMMQPVFGFISDKLQHRIFMLWGLILCCVFVPLTIKANSVFVFAMFLILGMVGNAFFHPQVSALIKDFNRKNPNLSRAMGIFLGLGTIGYAIGPYVSTYMVQNFGQDSLLYLTWFGILACIFIYFFVPKIPEKEYVAKENFFNIMKEILKNKTCFYLTSVSVIKSAVSISFGTYIPFLLQKQGFSLMEIGFIVTLFFIAGGFATIFSAKIENKIGANNVIVLSMLSILPLCVAFLLTFEKLKYFSIALFILTGFFILLSVGVLLVQAQKTMPKYTGVISGVMQGFSWGLGALFLAPLGFVGEFWGVDKILILMSLVAFLTGIYTLKHKCLD